MIILSSDHAGFVLKNRIKNWLIKEKKQVIDVGPTEYVKVDNYVVYAKSAVQKFYELNDFENNKIIIICGSGVGVSIVANRHKGVRAVLGYNAKIVKKAVEHNNVNCLCMGQNYVSFGKAKKMVNSLLNSSFLGDYHAERVRDIDK